MSHRIVADLLADGAWALAESRRLRDSSRRLGIETRALLLTYRPHRLRLVTGGRDGDDERAEHDILRSFAVYPAVKTFVGLSRGGHCAVCGGLIKPNEIEYDIEAGQSNITVDHKCYELFMEEMAKRPAA